MDDSDYRFLVVKESGALSIIAFKPSVSAPTTIFEDVRQELELFLRRSECQKLAIDLSTMAYLPSCMIGIFVSLSARGIEVHLANASDDVVDVMGIMGLQKQIHLNEFELSADESDVRSDNAKTDVPVAVIDGYIVPCKACNVAQPVGKALLGKTIRCRRCEESLHINTALLHVATHVYCTCPECEQQLKMSPEWVDSVIKCDFCAKSLRVCKIR